MLPALKDYTIIKQIGKGAMSRVYLAVENSTQRQVALKHLYLEQNENQIEALVRFRSEAQMIQGLSHPNIISMLDFIEQGKDFFIVMEYFPGGNLRSFICELSLKEKIAAMATISHTLSYLHSNEIIHRDLKPQNILLDHKNGTIKIIDFGLAYLQNLSSLFKNKEILGSFLYISPEQTGMLKRPVDHRSDLYSLGITFYELLTGSPPFGGHDPGQLIYKHLAMSPSPPSSLLPEISPALDQIVSKLLEKEPENRYQSAMGLFDDLSYLLEHPEEKFFAPGINDYSGKLNFKFQALFREKELSLITDSIHASTAEKKISAFLCYGPSGAGKSNFLWAAKTRLLKEKVLIFEHSSSHASTHSPFAPVRELCSFLAVNRPQISPEKILPPDLLEIFQELTLVAGSNKNSPPQSLPSGPTSILFKKLSSLLVSLLPPQQALAILLDDIQWLDSESLDFLQFLIQSEEILPVILILAARDEEEQNFRTHDFMKSNPLLKPLPITFFKREILPLFVDKALGHTLDATPLFYDKLYEITLGSPFYLLETLKTLNEKKVLLFSQGKWILDNGSFMKLKLSSDMHCLDFFSIQSFQPRELEILSIAALLGESFTLSLLGFMCDHYFTSEKPEITELIQVIDKARSKFLVEELLQNNQNRYEFVHEKVRYTFENLNTKKEFIHLACAAYLEKEFQQNINSVVFQLAYHYNLGNDLEKMLYYNQLSFKQALSQSAYRVALYYLEKVISYYENTPSLCREAIPYFIAFGHYLQVNGRIKESFAPLKKALEFCRNNSFSDFVTDLLLEIGTGYYYLNEINHSLEYYEEAFKLAQEKGLEVTIGYPYYLMGSNFWFVSKLHDALHYLSKAILYMREDDWDNKLPALAMRSATYIMLGDIENAFLDVKTMENNFGNTANILVLPHAYHCCSLCYSWSQRNFHMALDFSLKAHKIAKKSDNLIFEYSTLFSRALAYFHLENFPQAGEAIRLGIQMSREKNIFVGIYLLYAYEVEIHLWNGQLDKVLALCAQYLDNPKNVVEKLPLMLLFRARALAFYAQGRYEDALLALKEAASIFAETDMALMGITIPYLRGYFLQQSGRPEASSPFYGEVEMLLGKNPPLQVQLTHVKKLLRQLEKIKSEKDSYHSSSFSLKENLQLENIIKTSQKLSSILNIDKLLTVILENTLEVTGAERGALILLQDAICSKTSVFLQSNGETQSFHVPEEVIQQTLSRQKGIILHSQKQLNTLHENPLFASIKSIICAPLIIKEKIIGLLYLDSQLIQNLFSDEELKLLGVFTSQAAISIENAQLHTRMLRQAEIEKEIEVAKDIQLSLLPETELNADYEIGAFMQSAEEVGGDFYDFFLETPPYFGIFGDVSGHGLKSGLIMMMAEVAFNTIMASQISRLSPLPHIYQQLNGVLYKNIQQRLSIKSKAAKEYGYMYMTCKIFRFDPEGNFEIFGADYSAPFICKAKSGEIIELESKGFLLGIQTDATMGKEALSFRLEKDDLLVLYSDGITEAKKYSKEVIRRDKSKNYLFGTPRLYELITQNRHLSPKDLVSIIVNAARNWMHKQEDDITLTIIKKK